jgi:hypothetical protein
VDIKSLSGVVLDDSSAKLQGKWTISQSNPTYIVAGYQHESNGEFDAASATFQTELPSAGEYEVRLAYTANQNRATNVNVLVVHAGGLAEKTVNQKQLPAIDGLFVSLGKYTFTTNQPASVTVSNQEARHGEAA